MKKLLVVLIVMSINISYLAAQDTLIIYNNYKWRLGGKFIGERSGLSYDLSATKTVWNSGVQVIYRLSKPQSSKLFLQPISSLEGGLYLSTKVDNFFIILDKGSFLYRVEEVRFDYLSLPVNYRLDTRFIYVSAGLYLDYYLGFRTKYGYYPDSLSYILEPRPIQLGINMNVGLEKNISGLINLFVEGRYSANVTPYWKSSRTLGSGFINYGLAMGANYKFLK